MIMKTKNGSIAFVESNFKRFAAKTKQSDASGFNKKFSLIIDRQ